MASFAGSGEAGTLDGPLEQAQFYTPWSIAQDTNGDLWVTDTALRKIDMKKREVVTVVKCLYPPRARLDGPFDSALISFSPDLVPCPDGSLFTVESNRSIDSTIFRHIKDGCITTVATTLKKVLSFCMPHPNTIVFLPHLGIEMLDLKTGKIMVLKSDKKYRWCRVVPGGGILCGTANDMYLLGGYWKWKRLLWIAKLKENPPDCVLATIPADMIREISKHMKNGNKYQQLSV